MTTETTQPTRLDKIRPFMAWVVLPAILAMVAGVFVNFKVPWLRPGAVALLLLSAVPLWPVITAKPSKKVNWAGFFWLAVHVVLFATAGYLEWEHLKWPISPWLGFGSMVVIWIGVVIAISQIKVRGEGDSPSVHHVTPTVSDGAVKVTNKLAAKLGLPIGKEAEVDMGKFLQRMEMAAENERRTLDLEERKEVRAILEFGLKHQLIAPEEISARVRALAGITSVEEVVVPRTPRRRRDTSFEIPQRSKRRL